mmetsp:Transcript_110262/g.355592  ORF Transcript_110262/g.355592 Transcript_110262/m.355592 type:complete len:101 (-) Transcript_110262:47-349(-)
MYTPMRSARAPSVRFSSPPLSSLATSCSELEPNAAAESRRQVGPGQALPGTATPRITSVPQTDFNILRIFAALQTQDQMMPLEPAPYIVATYGPCEAVLG